MPDGSPTLSFFDADGKARLAAGVNPDGTAALGLIDGDGRPLFSAP